MAITPLPTPPSRSQSPDDFSTAADAFLGALPAFATEANALALAVNDDAAAVVIAAGEVAEAAGVVNASVAVAVGAAASVVSSASTQATSITPLTIGTGTRNFVLIQMNKAFSLGQVVNITSTANRANRMVGYIDDFTPGSGLMSVVVAAGGVFGSGSASAWTVSVGGAVGGAVACTEAELLAGAIGDKFVPPSVLYSAQSPKTVTYASTITLDGNVGINFNILLTGNVIMANPSNFKPGQSGRIRFKQDATGSRVLSSWGNKFLKPTGTPTWLSTTPNAIDIIPYFVNDDGMIELGLAKAFVAA